MKKIFLIAVFSLFAQLWMPQTSAQDVWATSYDGKDIYVVTETLSKESIPGVTAFIYTGMVKFVRGDELLETTKHSYKGSDDGLYLSINDGAFVRLGGNEGFPPSAAPYVAIHDVMWKTMKNART